MPARSSTPAQLPHPPNLQALISSTTYPQPFTLEQLEHLRHDIQSRRAGLHARLIALDPSEEDRMKQEKRERKRKERERLLALEEAERRAASPKPGVKVKRERTSLSPAASIISTSTRPAPPITYASHVKKKKNRVVDSDDEARERAAALASPPHAHHSTTSGLKVKLAHANAKSRPSLPSGLDPSTPINALAGPSTLTANIDFSLPTPASRPLVPPRPGVQKPLPPGPKKQSEVDEDYSNVKAPTQVAFPTFWSGVEPYIRDIREDDLAMLGFKADSTDLYDVPPRGRHYSEVWDDEDGNPPGTTPRISVPNLRQLNGTYPSTINIPPWIPSHELKEENLSEELRGLGSVTERVIAAVVSLDADPAAEGRMGKEFEGRDENKVDVRELEEKVKKELRAVMLLGEHEDFDQTRREDDEITAALRSCQRALTAQTALNDARKLRLAEKAKHRLAFAEYQNMLGGVESNIEENWAKRTKKHGHGKKGTSNSSSSRDSRPPVPELLKQLVRVRRNWVDSVGARMADRPRGELVGLPEESVYQGIGDGHTYLAGPGEEEDEERVEGEVGMEVDAEGE